MKTFLLFEANPHLAVIDLCYSILHSSYYFVKNFFGKKISRFRGFFAKSWN